MTLEYAQVAEITNSPSTVGIADSSLYSMSQADINKTLNQLQAIGVNNIRVTVPWGLIETSDDVYNWSQMDMVMSAAAARNMGVMADIASTPIWAAPPNSFTFAGTPPAAQFATFVQQVATKYGSTISAYEIWNEPNYTAFYQPIDPVSYTALLKAAYPVIKNIDPTATVVAGAVGAGQTTGATLNPVDFVTGMMAAGAGNYFDALSFHPYQDTLPFSAGYTYPGLGTPLEQLDAIKGLIGTAKSVWVSEYGLPTSTVSQQQQSAYIKDLLDYWQGYSQAGPVFIYTTRDGTSPGASASENSYGIFNNDWTPKLAAQMLQAWIKAHPTATTPTTPTPPTPPPADPYAAFFQALAAQYAAVVAAQYAALVNAYAAAFQQLATQLGAPAATVATPLTAKVASVQTTSPASLAAPAYVEVTAADSPLAADAALKPATDEATAAVTAANAAADIAIKAEAVAVSVVGPVTPVIATTPAAVTTPTTTDPVVPKPVVAETSATEPVVTKPIVKPIVKPVVKPIVKPVVKPIATLPIVTKPAETTPAASTPAASGADEGAADKPDKPGADKPDKPGANKPDKPGANKSSADKSEAAPRVRPKAPHHNGSGAGDNDSTAGATSMNAPAGAK